MGAFNRKHLLGTEDLTKEEIIDILNRAKEYKKDLNCEKHAAILKGKLVIMMFYEPSTRTSSSFEIAAQRLGSRTIGFSPSSSAVTKGETLIDTAKNIEAMKPDAIVLRHSNAGTPYLLSKIQNVPVLNAGDGNHEHPTQALLDLFTIMENKPKIEGLNVLIVGDIAHSRVARSNIYALNTMGAKVSICGPATMLPPKIESLNVKSFTDLRKAMEGQDVVMMLRIQKERGGSQTQFPTLREYSRFWGLNQSTIKYLKDGAIIMHPGPMNRGVEISQVVADGPYSVILSQVTNGVAIRMALLDKIINRKGDE